MLQRCNNKKKTGKTKKKTFITHTCYSYKRMLKKKKKTEYMKPIIIKNTIIPKTKKHEISTCKNISSLCYNVLHLHIYTRNFD